MPFQLKPHKTTEIISGEEIRKRCKIPIRVEGCIQKYSHTQRIELETFKKNITAPRVPAIVAVCDLSQDKKICYAGYELTYR